MELAARMLVLGGVARTARRRQRQVRGAIASGAGLERFRRIIEQQGGDPRVVDDYASYCRRARTRRGDGAATGFLAALDAELVGRASVALGAGRDRVEDSVDPAVGIMVVAKPGDRAARRRSGARAPLPRSRAPGAAAALAARAIRSATTARRSPSLSARSTDERRRRSSCGRRSDRRPTMWRSWPARLLGLVAALAAQMGVTKAQPLVGASSSWGLRTRSRPIAARSTATVAWGSACRWCSPSSC